MGECEVSGGHSKRISSQPSLNTVFPRSTFLKWCCLWVAGYSSGGRQRLFTAQAVLGVTQDCVIIRLLLSFQTGT